MLVEEKGHCLLRERRTAGAGEVGGGGERGGASQRRQRGLGKRKGVVMVRTKGDKGRGGAGWECGEVPHTRIHFTRVHLLP